MTETEKILIEALICLLKTQVLLVPDTKDNELKLATVAYLLSTAKLLEEFKGLSEVADD